MCLQICFINSTDVTPIKYWNVNSILQKAKSEKILLDETEKDCFVIIMKRRSFREGLWKQVHESFCSKTTIKGNVCSSRSSRSCIKNEYRRKRSGGHGKPGMIQISLVTLAPTWKCLIQSRDLMAELNRTMVRFKIFLKVTLQHTT